MANPGKAPLTFNLNKNLDKSEKPKEIIPKNEGKKIPREKAASREGRQFVAAHVKPEVVKQLKMIGIQHDKTIQSLLIDAINDIFHKYGVSRIAD